MSTDKFIRRLREKQITNLRSSIKMINLLKCLCIP